ncbi:MAG: hypothetical protein U1E63_01575 [Burkholderiales bacterium]
MLRQHAAEITDLDAAGEHRHAAERLDLAEFLVVARDLDAQRIRHYVLHHETDGDQQHGGKVPAPAFHHGGERAGDGDHEAGNRARGAEQQIGDPAAAKQRQRIEATPATIFIDHGSPVSQPISATSAG